jgi:HD-GYP domain-containing protein (c-di-GMP phosphodiesterase class II)/ABC-type amino acid transport substrate-binding protein
MKKIALLIFLLLFTYGDTIRIVYNPGTPPLKFTINNQATGMLIDIWKEWARVNNHKLIFIEAPWDETLELIKSGKADVHAGLYYTQERDQFLDYTATTLYKSRNYFFYHKSVSGIFDNSDLLPYVIGVDNGYAREYIEKEFPSASVTYYDSTQELHQGAIHGDVKVLLSPVANLIYALKVNYIDDEFRYLKNSPAFFKNYYGAVKSGNQKMLNLIDTGFKRIDPNVLQSIENLWLENLDESYLKNYEVNLSDEEKEWIKQHRILSVGVTEYLPPLSFKDSNGDKVGFVLDYLEYISEKTGLKFEYKIEADKSVDISATAIVNHNVNDKIYSNSYATYDFVYVTRESSSFIASFSQLKDKRILLIEGNPIISQLQSYYPDIEIDEVGSIQEALELVASGDYDVFIEALAVVTYAIKEGGYNLLKIAGKSEFQSKYAFAYNTDQKILKTIIDKVLQSMSVEQKNSIFKKYVGIKLQEEIDYTLLYQIVGIGLFILAVVLFYTAKIRLLNRDIVHKTRYLNSVLDTDESLIITTNGYKIQTANRAFLDFFGVEHLDQFLENSNCVCNYFGGDPKKFIQEQMGDQTWIEYILSHEKESQLAQIEKGGEIFFFHITASVFEINGESIYTVDLTNVTQLEEIKNDIEHQVELGLAEIKALNNEIEETQKEIVYTMGAVGESRSKETGNHVKRVALYSELLAREYGLTKEQIQLLKSASPMHDIGKIAIPDAILNKPAKLTDEEFVHMKRHAELGYEIFKHSNRPILQAAAIVAYEHHEKYNGKGYPRALKGEDIHIFGRITALADVYDALSSDRVYKKAWSDDRIHKLLKEERGEHFDPRLIDIFFDKLNEIEAIRESLKDKFE